MVRLLETTLTDLDNICQVLANLPQQPAPNRTLAEEETIQRVLMLCTLLLERVEVLMFPALVAKSPRLIQLPLRDLPPESARATPYSAHGAGASRQAAETLALEKVRRWA